MHTPKRHLIHAHANARTHQRPIRNSYCSPTAKMIRKHTSVMCYMYTACLVTSLSILRKYISTFPFCSSIFHCVYHRLRLLLLSSFHVNPSPLFFAPGVVFICKNLTTSIMAYYPIAPLCCSSFCCCCLVPWF
jgi:hypothetical protein